MKKIILAVFLFVSFGVFAQTVTKEDFEKEVKSLNDRIKVLENRNAGLNVEISVLKTGLSDMKSEIDQLNRQIQANKLAINETAKELGMKITETETKADQRITNVDQSLGKTTLWVVIGILSVLLISGVLYWLLNKRQKSDKSDLAARLNETKLSIEESLIKEFGKQTDLMDAQLQLIEQQKLELQSKPDAEPDHSLALKVAGEINLIERNIHLMDANTKGLKQLQASMGKLKDNLAANGYDMPILLGKQYHQGMKVIVVNSVPDENLEKDSEIITKILIPQVNYKDKMIQIAQIEISVGY